MEATTKHRGQGMGKTSSEVKNRYNAKAYKRYTVFLRKGDDDIHIKRLEQAKEAGVTLREILIQGIEALDK